MVSLVMNNTQAQTKIKLLQDIENGIAMVHSLDEHYLVSGIY